MLSIPIVTITSVDKQTISDEIGYTQCVCKFTVDCDIYKWEARAVPGKIQPDRGHGYIVEYGNNLKKGNEGIVIVDYRELTNGDGVYTISIYVQNFYGIWSNGDYTDIHFFKRYNQGLKYNTMQYYNSK